MKFAIALLIAASFPISASAEVTVSQPWARASILASRPGAAYLTLSSDTNDRLLSASTPVAAQVMIHAAETDAGGVSRMMHLEMLDLPAGKTVTFFPGSMHLMLMGLADKLEEGASFPLTLTFEVTGDVTVEVPVLGIAATGPEATDK